VTVPTPVVEWAPAQGPFETVDTYADLTGASGVFVSTPDSTSFNIQDLDVAARVTVTDLTNGVQVVVSKDAFGAQRSFVLAINGTGNLIVETWNEAGVALSNQASTVILPFSDGDTFWVRATVDINNGAGGNTATYFYAADQQTEPTTWTTLGTTRVRAVTGTTLYDSTAAVQIGAQAGSSRLTGRVYRVLIRNGIAGTLVSEFHADRDSISGSSTFVSETGETWTFNGAASRVSDWADISTDVQAGSVTTGRQYEFDRFNAGSASITWVSESRLFDFDNASSTYFGQLQPMRQFRIRMRRSSQVWPIFRGYCIDWDQTVDSSDKVMFTTVRLADAFALLDATKAPSPYATAVLAKSPRFYARFDDANQVYDSSTFANHGTWGTLATIVSGLLTNDASNAVSMSATSYGQGALQPPTSWTDFTLEFWIQTTTSDAALLSWTTGSSSTPSVFSLAGGKLRATWNGLLFTDEFNKVLNDGVRHHVVYRSNGLVGSAEIDGVAVTNTGTSYVFIPSGLSVTNTYRLGYNPATGLAGFVGTLDELALYSSTSTASTYTTGIAPWQNQTTGARVTAILDAISWPAALRDIDTGDSTMQTASISSDTALGAIQQAADTELGQTFVDEYGNIRHRSRSSLWLSARSKTSQVTFNDRHSGTTKIYSNQGFSMVRDALLLRNPVTASRANGTTITRQDDTLITEFGLRDYQAPTSYDSSDLVVSDRAEFLLGRYKNLQTRLESMTINVHRDPADLTATVGTTTIGTRITVQRLPLNTGSTTSIEQIVEGITHQFAPQRWSTTYRASPLETTVYFILDDATYGQLDEEPLGY